MALSKPVLYAAGLGIVIAAYVQFSDSGTAPKKLTKKRSGASTNDKPDWIFPIAETSLHFDKPTPPQRNIFVPLVAIDHNNPEKDPTEQMKVPANYAGGEGNWSYTGMVEVDGVKMALLENPSMHLSGYVRESEVWKKSKIGRISAESILFFGPDGKSETVFRFNPDIKPKVKPGAEGQMVAGVDPNNGLRGPIGGQNFAPGNMNRRGVIQMDGAPPGVIMSAPSGIAVEAPAAAASAPAPSVKKVSG